MALEQSLPAKMLDGIQNKMDPHVNKSAKLIPMEKPSLGKLINVFAPIPHIPLALVKTPNVKLALIILYKIQLITKNVNVLIMKKKVRLLLLIILLLMLLMTLHLMHHAKLHAKQQAQQSGILLLILMHVNVKKITLAINVKLNVNGLISHWTKLNQLK